LDTGQWSKWDNGDGQSRKGVGWLWLKHNTSIREDKREAKAVGTDFSEWGNSGPIQFIFADLPNESGGDGREVKNCEPLAQWEEEQIGNGIPSFADLHKRN
jgi:hypothetical protein